jgi:hypothetical protein
MSGSGSLTGFQFKEDGVLPSTTSTATQLVPTQYNSKLVGGRRRLRSSRSLKSRSRSSGFSTLRLRGGRRRSRKSKKSRRNKKTTKGCMWTNF